MAPTRSATLRSSRSISGSVVVPYSAGSRVPSMFRFGPCRTSTRTGEATEARRSTGSGQLALDLGRDEAREITSLAEVAVRLHREQQEIFAAHRAENRGDALVAD